MAAAEGSTSGEQLTAARLAAHAKGSGGLIPRKSSAESLCLSHGAGSDSPQGSDARQFRRGASKDAVDGGSVGRAEKLPPRNLGPTARWGWKLKQLTCTSATDGVTKYGHERNTAQTYANDADAANESKMGTAIRLRTTRHEKLENLSHGGFTSREFATLKADMRDIKTCNLEPDDWSFHAQGLTTKRFCHEDCKQPGWVLQHWGEFLSRIVGWPLPGDTESMVWDCEAHAARLVNASPEEKMELFLELFTEYAAKPLIDLGQVGHDDLLEILQMMSAAIHAASDQLRSEDYEDVLEQALSRIRGTAAFVSRKHGHLESTRADAAVLQGESEVGTSSLYGALSQSDYYSDFVAEYWRTIAAADKLVPVVKKAVTTLEKTSYVPFTLAAVKTLQANITLVTKTAPKLRPTQIDSLKKEIATGASHLVQQVVSVAAREAWVHEHLDELIGVLKFPEWLGQVDGLEVANVELQKVKKSASKHDSLEALLADCNGFPDQVGKVSTMVDLDPAALFDMRGLVECDIIPDGPEATSVKNALASSWSLAASENILTANVGLPGNIKRVANFLHFMKQLDGLTGAADYQQCIDQFIWLIPIDASGGCIHHFGSRRRDPQVQ